MKCFKFLYSAEQTILNELLEHLYTYRLQKNIYSSLLKKQFSDVYHYLSATQPLTVEKSNVIYYKVLDAIADEKDTLMFVLQDLHSAFIEKKSLTYLLLEGDAKLYEVLQAIKFEYGCENNWLLPLPGDWHLLKLL